MAFIIIIIITIFILYLTSFYKTVRKMYELWVAGEKIPGPPAHPIFGNVGLFTNKSGEELHDVLKEQAQLTREKGHNVMRLQMMGQLVVWPLNGKMCAKILESTTELDKGDDYSYYAPWIGGGIILEGYGERWKSHRKMLTSTFHFAKLEGYLDVFNSESKIFIDCLDKYAETGETVDVFPFIKRCTLDIICGTAMGTKVDAQYNHNHKYVEAVEQFNQLAVIKSMNPLLRSKIFATILGYEKKTNECLYTLKKFTNDVISERRAAIASGEAQKETSKRKMNFLDILLDNEESNVLSEEDIRQEVDTFMFAGHDTTTTSLSWLIWNLAHNQDIQQKVYEELVQVFGDDPSDDLTSVNINKLEYTERVIKESKRLIAPVPAVQRKLRQPLEMDGYTIPSETNISIAQMLIHTNPNVYTNPDVFDPDRFLPDEVSKRNAYDYIPFSAGLRNCIGQKFSQINEKVMIIHLMRNYRIEPMLKFNETKPVLEIVAKPSNGIPVKLIRRG